MNSTHGPLGSSSWWSPANNSEPFPAKPRPSSPATHRDQRFAVAGNSSPRVLVGSVDGTRWASEVRPGRSRLKPPAWPWGTWQGGGVADVMPFRITVGPHALDDLRTRLRRTRWAEQETVDDWSQGVPLDYLRRLCGYWAEGHDWPATQARLNEISQFVTTIDALDIHFLHVRSPHPAATPLLLTHGWPGSFLEFEGTLQSLTDPPD